MLPSWLPALAIATRPAAIKGADEILADMLRACGNVQAAAPTAEGRLLFSTRHQRVVVLAIAEACLEGAKRIRKKRRRKRAAPLLGPINELVREIGFWQSVAYLSDDRFRRKFRLSRAAFRDLATLLEPHLTRTGGRGGARSGHAAPPLSVEIKLSVALRFLAGAAVEDLDRYGVARKSSVMGSCVWPVVNAIHACPELEYRLLRALKSAKAGDTTELDQIQAGFDAKSSGMLPGCIGALDGWLPAIQRPPVSETLPPPPNKAAPTPCSPASHLPALRNALVLGGQRDDLLLLQAVLCADVARCGRGRPVRATREGAAP